MDINKNLDLIMLSSIMIPSSLIIIFSLIMFFNYKFYNLIHDYILPITAIFDFIMIISFIVFGLRMLLKIKDTNNTSKENK